MGQFSWLDCETKEQILCGEGPVYVLVPKEFGGGHIVENCYDGYGNFGGQDIFDLVAGWNHEMVPEIIASIESGDWKGAASRNDVTNMWNFYNGEPYIQSKQPFPFKTRTVGIIIACWDEDNVRLQYPIKITHSPDAVYEDCNPSLSDPNQGWMHSEV